MFYHAHLYDTYLLEEQPLLSFNSLKTLLSLQSRIIFGWRLLNVVTISYLFYAISLRVFFLADWAKGEGVLGKWMWALCAILFLDMVLQVLTQKYQQDKIVDTVSQAGFYYLKHMFALDLISQVVLVIGLADAYTDHTRFFLLLFLLKIFKLWEYDRWILLNLWDLRARTVYKLIKVFYVQLFFCNLIGSIFYLIDLNLYLTNSYQKQDLWLFNSSALQNIYNLPVSQRFVYALYWAVTTTISIGYGDIIPLNPVQNLYLLFVFFLSIFLYSYFLNTFWSILKDYDAYNPASRLKHYQLQRTLAVFKVPIPLIYQAGAYMNQIWNNDFKVAHNAIQQLSEQLRIKFLSSLYFQQLKRGPFKILANALIIQQLAVIIKQKWLSHGNSIFNLSRDERQPKLVYLCHGNLLVRVLNNRWQTISKQKINKYYGVRQFLTQERDQNIDYISKGISQISIIDYSEFQKLLIKIGKSQILKQPLHAIRFNLEEKNNLIDQNCYYCKSKLHLLRNCPQLTWTPSFPIIVQQLQTRRAFTRNQRKLTVVRNRRIKISKSVQTNLPKVRLWQVNCEKCIRNEYFNN